MNCDPQALINELTAIASAVINTRADDQGALLDKIEQAINTGQGVAARRMIADGYRRSLLADAERAGLVAITYQVPPLPAV